MLLTQFPGDVIAAALAEEEAHRLDHRHHGEHHPHRAGGGIAFQHSNKIGIRHVVKGGDQHTHNAGHCQAADQLFHGRGGHFYVFFFLCVHLGSSFSFLSSIPQFLPLRQGSALRRFISFDIIRLHNPSKIHYAF